jgi:hypothetical protein
MDKLVIFWIVRKSVYAILCKLPVAIVGRIYAHHIYQLFLVDSNVAETDKPTGRTCVHIPCCKK